ncbi:hypothetical protein DH2020_024245 [Rehmannia glutinosa]|uniref:pectinesterase n=1 Tax=Rehmannia glutinosa TaxID=99300 RepID=A0ABR0W897_REHGL
MSWLPATGVKFTAALAVGSRGGDTTLSQKFPPPKGDYVHMRNDGLPTNLYRQLKLIERYQPKELIEVAFQAAIKAKSALESCNELANRAANDLQRSFAKFNNFDIINVDDILLELKIWLSGAITNEETCLDGFEDVPGDAGQKMRDALKTAMQMTSNSLAMVAEISTFLESMGIQGFKSRRLLSEDFLPVVGHGGELPDWMDFNQRRLLSAPSQQIRRISLSLRTGVASVYEEKVWFNSSLTHLMIIGDGPTKTKITGKLNFIDGTGTYQTATVAVQGDDFIARDIGFENSAGPEKHQAVALRVSADRAIFYNCQMDGYQDTLYVHTYRQFYRDCVISGTIDFIFGDSAAVFQGCTLLVRKPMDNQQNIVTAQGRKDVASRRTRPPKLHVQGRPEYHPLRNKLKTYLGRPWKEYSRTIIMESFLDDLIQPQGWLPWNATFALETLFYTEFNNRGPGAPKAQRIKWPGVKELPPNRIQRFTAAEFLDGNRWIPPTRVPYAAGFIFPVPKEDPNIKYSPVVPEETKDLGSPVDKTALVASGNDSSSKKETGSKKSPAPPASPPPPPPPPVSIPPSDIAIPSDILPSTTPTPSPVSIPQSEITAAPISSPIASPVSIPPVLSPRGNSVISVPDSVTAAPPPSSLAGNSVPISQPSFATSPTFPPKSSIDSPPPTSPTGDSSPISQPDLASSPSISPKSNVEESEIPASSHISAYDSQAPISQSDLAVPSPASSPTSQSDVAAPPPTAAAVGGSRASSPSGDAVSIHQSNEAATPKSSLGSFDDASSPSPSPVL